MEKIPLIIIIGPTAVGKTRLGVDIATELKGEIISGDSMQVYKYLDIGTAKIKQEETNGIPHYLIDIKYPDQQFSVAEFKEKAEIQIKEIYSKGKIPIIVGGTGLYIRAVTDDLNLSNTTENTIIREKLWEDFYNNGIEPLWTQLERIDPLSANRIQSKNDTRRIIRALEVYFDTGKPMSEQLHSTETISKYSIKMIGLTIDRQELYNRINQRVDNMIEKGLVEEFIEVTKKGYSLESPGFQGIGYKQLVPYLKNEYSLEKAIELIKRDTRRFAKRQLTWFRKDPKIDWYAVDQFSNYQNLKNKVIEDIRRSLSNFVE